MAQRRTNPAFLNGVPELLVLHLLDRTPMYGYQLVQAIKQATGQRLKFGEGCIYPLLHRLEGEGLLSACSECVAGRSRIVYRSTAKGQKHYSGLMACWQHVIRAVNHALQGGEHGEPVLA